MGRFLDLVRRGLQHPSRTPHYEIDEIAEKRVTDPYQARARNALNQICRSDCPTGLLPVDRKGASAALPGADVWPP